MKEISRLIPICLLVLALAALEVQAQTTTIYVVRHAEKDTSDPENKDPELTEEGRKRAAALQELLKDEKIEAIFSTDYHRTRKTAEPLSASQKTAIEIYDPAKLTLLAETLKKDFKGKKILIVGHSNSSLNTVEALGGKRPLSEIPESDYDNLIKVTILADGTVETTVTQYGKRTD